MLLRRGWHLREATNPRVNCPRYFPAIHAGASALRDSDTREFAPPVGSTPSLWRSDRVQCFEEVSRSARRLGSHRWGWRWPRPPGVATRQSRHGLSYDWVGREQQGELVKSCGAEVFIDISKTLPSSGGQALSKEVLSATGGKVASAVFVCSSSHAAYAQARLKKLIGRESEAQKLRAGTVKEVTDTSHQM